MELLLIFAWLVLEIAFGDLVAKSVRFEPVEVDLVNDKTDRVIGDRYER